MVQSPGFALPVILAAALAAVPARADERRTFERSGAASGASPATDRAQSNPFAISAALDAKADKSALALDPADYAAGACLGAGDDTCALRATIADACAGSRGIRLTRSYTISDTLTVVSGCKGFTIEGGAMRQTYIVSTALDKPILEVAGLGAELHRISLDYAGTPRPGASALRWTASAGRVVDVFVAKSDVAFDVRGGSISYFSRLLAENYRSSAFSVENANDVFVNQFVFHAGSATNGALGGIRLYGQAEAISFTDGDVLEGVWSLVTDAPSDTLNGRPAYNRFTNVYFDSSALGSSIRKLYGTTFTGGWFSAGRSGAGFPGVTVESGDTISFAGTQFFNSGSSGALIKAGTRRVTFTAGWSAQGNGVTSGAGVASGLLFEAGTSDFNVTNGSANSVGGLGAQKYGIEIAAGASDRYVVTGNLVSGNAVGGLLDGGTGRNKLVQGNF